MTYEDVRSILNRTVEITATLEEITATLDSTYKRIPNISNFPRIFPRIWRLGTNVRAVLYSSGKIDFEHYTSHSRLNKTEILKYLSPEEQRLYIFHIDLFR